jgi:hypothetical protein
MVLRYLRDWTIHLLYGLLMRLMPSPPLPSEEVALPENVVPLKRSFTTTDAYKYEVALLSQRFIRIIKDHNAKIEGFKVLPFERIEK